MNELPKNRDPRCAEIVKMAERELAAYFECGDGVARAETGATRSKRLAARVGDDQCFAGCALGMASGHDRHCETTCNSTTRAKQRKC